MSTNDPRPPRTNAINVNGRRFKRSVFEVSCQNDLLDSISTSVAEASKLGGGKFDGLTGNIPRDASPLIQDVISHLRYFLLKEKGLTEYEIRTLQKSGISQDARRHIAEFAHKRQDEMLDEALLETFPASDPIAVTPIRPLVVSDGIWLALELLNSIESAYRVSEDESQKLIYGTAGVGRFKSNKNLRASTESVTDDQIRAVLVEKDEKGNKQYPTQEKQAKRLGITVRHLLRRLKGIKQSG